MLTNSWNWYWLTLETTATLADCFDYCSGLLTGHGLSASVDRLGIIHNPKVGSSGPQPPTVRIPGRPQPLIRSPGCQIRPVPVVRVADSLCCWMVTALLPSSPGPPLHSATRRSPESSGPASADRLSGHPHSDEARKTLLHGRGREPANLLLFIPRSCSCWRWAAKLGWFWHGGFWENRWLFGNQTDFFANLVTPN